MAAKALGPNEATARMAQPFQAWDLIRPSLNSAGGPWGWTHYGIYIPRLPSPHQYLNVLVLNGLVDLSIFNHDELAHGPGAVVRNGEHLTTVMTSTAAGNHTFARGYDSTTECSFPDAGTPLRWGEQFRMAFTFPHRAVVSGTLDGWAYELDVEIGPRAVWFVATPFYEHFSLPISGTVCFSASAGEGPAAAVSAVSGCIEYARCKPPAGMPREVHAQVARSTDYFIYHVVEAGEGRDRRQVLWGEMRNAFVPPRKFAYVRTVPDGHVLEAFTTELDVQILRDEVVTDSLGRRTRMPREFRARVVSAGREVLEVVGRVNAPLRDGAGRGYVSGYEAVVRYGGEERKGSGMFEWVDLSLHAGEEERANL